MDARTAYLLAFTSKRVTATTTTYERFLVFRALQLLRPSRPPA